LRRTSYAAWIAWKRTAASASPGAASGWFSLGEAAVGGLDVFEAGVDLDFEELQRTHLLAAAGAVAGAGPGIVSRLLVAVGAAALVGFALGGVLG
jgi:hypothetical protein